jgi:hypothetical protein
MCVPVHTRHPLLNAAITIPPALIVNAILFIFVVDSYSIEALCSIRDEACWGASTLGTHSANLVICLFAPCACRAMAWQRFGGKKKVGDRGGSKRGGKDGQPTKWIKSVALYKLFLKSKLRSYADETGSMLLCEQKAPQKVLTVKNVREDLSAETSELIKRPAMGVNLAAATMASGLEVLALFPPEKDIAKESREGYAKTQVLKMQQMLPQDCEGIVTVLNVASEKCKDRAEYSKFLKKFFDFFGRKADADKRMQTYAKTADLASRLYGLAMSCIEVTAIATSPKDWAKRLEELDKQEPGVRKFAANPSLEHLIRSIAKENADRVMQKSKKKKGSRFGADSEESDANEEDVGDGSRSGSQNTVDKHEDTSDDESDEASSTGSEKVKKAKQKGKQKKGLCSRRQKKSKAAKPPPKKRSSSSSSEEEKPRAQPRPKACRTEVAEVLANLKADSDTEATMSVLSTQWDQGDVQMTAAAIDTMKYGSPSLADLQKLFRSIPKVVLEGFDLVPLQTKLDTLEHRPKMEQVLLLLNQITNVTEKFEGFFVAQQAPSASSQGAGPAATQTAESKKEKVILKVQEKEETVGQKTSAAADTPKDVEGMKKATAPKKKEGE